MTHDPRGGSVTVAPQPRSQSLQPPRIFPLIPSSLACRAVPCAPARTGLLTRPHAGFTQGDTSNIPPRTRRSSLARLARLGCASSVGPAPIRQGRQRFRRTERPVPSARLATMAIPDNSCGVPKGDALTDELAYSLGSLEVFHVCV